MDTQLSPELHEFIAFHASTGDALAKQGHYEEAVRVYNEAWSRVPEPKSEWEASTWLLAAIGDACFRGGFFGSGEDAFAHALHCPGGAANPFIHLRLGQCSFESGNRPRAVEYLTRAYGIHGKGIFEREDPKYFEFLKTRLEAPAGGEW